jgi:hypothetical protein
MLLPNWQNDCERFEYGVCGSVALGIFPGEVSAKQSRAMVTLTEMDYRVGNVFTLPRRGFLFKNGNLTTFVKM